MSKLLDGTSTGNIRDNTSGAPLTLSGAISMLAVIKFASVGTWASLIECEDATSNGLRAALLRHSSGTVAYADESANSGDSTVSIGTGDGWMIVAITKATGSSAPACHKLPIGGSRTSANGAAVGSADDTIDGEVILGGDDDPANIYIAAAAIFNVQLTTGQLDGILSAKTTASINALSPIWLADDSNGFSNELISNRALSSGAGVSNSGDNPSGWVYGLSGGNVDVTGVSAQATGSGPQPLVSTLTRPYTLVTIS